MNSPALRARFLRGWALAAVLAVAGPALAAPAPAAGNGAEWDLAKLAVAAVN